MRVPFKVLTIQLAAMLIASAAPPTTFAQVKTHEFRIESQVYVGDGPTPVSQNITLFADGIVYDFQMPSGASATPSEVVMFDEGRRELILLDMKRKLAWTVADLRLLKMVDQLRHETMSNEKANFLVKQPFTETHDWSSDVVSVESESIRYLLKGQRPDDETILPRYFDFLDQFTRLSASDPKRLPPFARLTLNKTIKSVGWIPSEVKVNIDVNEFFPQPFAATSKHVLVMSLSNEDRERIELARKCWFEFKPCSLLEYREIKTPSTLGKRLASRRSTPEQSQTNTAR